MSTDTTTRPASDTRSAQRAERIQTIVDGALTREQLGQSALHKRPPSGEHEVSLYDRTAGRMRTWSGATLAAAIGAAQRREKEQG
jgi:hypothetical protein